MTWPQGLLWPTWLRGCQVENFSVTRLTVTTVLTTTEVITAPSAERLYKIRCPQDNDKNTVPCGGASVFYRNSLEVLQEPCQLFITKGLEKGKLQGVECFAYGQISKQDFKPRALPSRTAFQPGHRGACTEECLVTKIMNERLCDSGTTITF